MKYTKEILTPLVESSTSVSQIIRKLGLKQTGGTQTNLNRWIRTYGLSTKHFLGQAANRGNISPKKIHFLLVLVDNRLAGRKENCFRLKRAMLEYGFLHICETCKCKPFWLGKKLVLQIDHKNGDHLDNRPENVRFLCPNCHSQTENFGSKNKVKRQ